MFGYIRPQKPELLVREFEEYKGVYCALCRRLGRDYGPAARLVLNYDCTFYALVLFSVSGGSGPGFCAGRCVVNPLKKCSFCEDSGEALASAAALTVILAYYKARDDLTDSGFFHGLAARMAYPFLALMHRRAGRKYPFLEESAADMMREQTDAERADGAGTDGCAEPTARMLARVFERLRGEGTPQSRVLHEVGYYLGRWTYLMDAADDMEKDIGHGEFNPFAVHFRLNRDSPCEALNSARDYANETLNGTLAKLGSAVDLLALGCFGPIVRNIVFLGLPQMQKERLFTKENGNVRSV